MKNILRLLLEVFAVLSLTDILVYQKIAKPIRVYFGWLHDSGGNPTKFFKTGSKVRDFFGQAIECFRCTSVWVAVLLWVTHKLPGADSLRIILAASWLATFINRKSY